MKKSKKQVETILISVKEYVETHNIVLPEGDKAITRHDVYKMIKNGDLKAHKNKKGAWEIEIEIPTKEEQKELGVDKVKAKKPSSNKKKSSTKTKGMSVKEFVKQYNEKHAKHPSITVSEVRKMIAEGLVEAKKIAGKWSISTSPRRLIK